MAISADHRRTIVSLTSRFDLTDSFKPCFRYCDINLELHDIINGSGPVFAGLKTFTPDLTDRTLAVEDVFKRWAAFDPRGTRLVTSRGSRNDFML